MTNYLEKIELSKSIRKKLIYIEDQKEIRKDSLSYWLEDFNKKKFIEEIIAKMFFILSFILINFTCFFIGKEIMNFFDNYNFLIFSSQIIILVISNGYLLYQIYKINKWRRNKEYLNTIAKEKSRLFKIIYKNVNTSYKEFNYIKCEDFLTEAVEKVISKLTKPEKEFIIKNNKNKIFESIMYNKFPIGIEQGFFDFLRNEKNIEEVKKIDSQKIEKFLEEYIIDKEKAYLMLDKIKNKKEIINKQVISL